MKKQTLISKYNVPMMAFLATVIVSKITMAPDNIARVNELNRVSHAKELLGKRFPASAVSKTTSKVSLHNFVYQKTKSQLKGHWNRRSSQVSKTIIESANKYGLDPLFIMAIVRQESYWNPSAIGTVGELGLMQIRPTTAKWVCGEMGIPWKGTNSLKNPVVNIEIGAAYIYLLRKDLDYHGQMYLSAYNMGKNKVFKSIRIKNHMPREYASKVMKHYVGFYTELNESLTYAERIEEMARNYRLASVE